jgi:uncharacterized repeat protein (TIGR01451 family)
MRLFGGIPNIRKTIARAVFALGAVVCVATAATPAAAQVTASWSVPPSYTISYGTPETKSFNSAIKPGEVTAMLIKITNSNTANPLQSTAFNFDLRADASSGLTLVDAGRGNGAVASYKCADGSGTVAVNSNGSTIVNAPVTGAAGAQLLTMSGGVVPIAVNGVGQGICEILVYVTSYRQDGNTFVIQDGAVTGDDSTAPTPKANVGAAPQTISVDPFTAPTFSKSFTPTAGQFGATTTLKFTIVNNDTSASLPLSSPSFTDNLGAIDMAVAATPAVVQSAGCTGVTVTAGANATSVQVAGGSVAPGATCNISVNVVATLPGDKVNTIPKTAFLNVRGSVPAVDASATYSSGADFAVTGQFLHDPVADSKQDQFQITFTNNTASTISMSGSYTNILGRNDVGDSAAAGDPITALTGFTGLRVDGFVSGTCGSASAANVAPSADGKSYVLQNLTFPVGSCTITVNYTGRIVNTGDPSQFFKQVIAAGAIPLAGGIKNGSALFGVNVYKTLVVDKLILDASGADASNANLQIAGGQAVRFKLVTGNYGSNDKVVITDPLPGNMTILVDATHPLEGSTDDPLCQAPNFHLQAGGDPHTPVFIYDQFPTSTNFDAKRCALTFWALVPATATDGGFTNTMNKCHVRSGVGAGNPTNSRNYADMTGSCSLRDIGVSGRFAPPISINEQFSQATQSIGGVVTLTYTLSNLGGFNLTQAHFTNALPAGLVIAPTPNVHVSSGGTCLSLNVSDVTATAGAGVVTAQNITIGPRDGGGLGPTPGQCTISVDVTSSSANTYVNKILGNGFQGEQVQADGTSTATAMSPAQDVVAQVVFNASLLATKTFFPPSVSPGGSSRVTVTINNTGATPYTALSLTDPLPADMKVDDNPNPVSNCGTPTFNPVANASSASLTGGVLAAGASCTISFNVKTITPHTGNWTNSIPPGGITVAGGVQNGAAVTKDLVNDSSQQIVVTNIANPSALVAPGQTSALIVTLKNNGSTRLTGVAVSDYLTLDGTSNMASANESAMIIAPTPNKATDCLGGDVTVVGNKQFSLTGGILDPGQQCTFQVDVTLLKLNNWTNKIPIGAVTTNEGVKNGSAASTNLALAGDIGVAKSFSPTLVKPGAVSTLTITLYNLLTVPVTSLGFTDTLPAGLSFAPTPNAATTCGGPTPALGNGSPKTITLSGGGLSAAASGGFATSCQVTVDVVGATVGVYPNTIAINDVAGTASGSSVKNAAPASASLQVWNPVSVQKAFTDHSRAPGQPTHLTITIDNTNNSTSFTGASLTDSFPSGLNIIAAPGPTITNTCGATTAVVALASAQQLKLSGGTIPAGATCSFGVDVVSNIPGTYPNQIGAGAVHTLVGVSNENTAQDSFSVVENAGVTKAFAPATIAPNAISQLTITLKNGTAVAGTLVAPFTDTLPTTPGLIKVAAGAIGGTCNIPDVTAVLGSGAITFANGATIPAGGCTIIVPVTGATIGAHTNQIAVNQLQTTVGNNTLAANAVLQISTPSGAGGTLTVGGKVYNDVNDNGVVDADEAGLAGVTVILSGTSAGGDPVSLSATTDANGDYLFTTVPASDAAGYTITELQPPQADGKTTAPTGTANSTKPVSPGGNDQITGVVVTTTAITGYNFGERGGSATITGKVYKDLNDNGVPDAGEDGISGVTVTLTGTDKDGKPVSLTTTSNAFGVYSFAPPASNAAGYTITETQPALGDGKTTAPGVGSATSSKPVATGQPDVITGVIFGTNPLAGYNFGELDQNTKITGYVFGDTNNNGVKDTGEQGLAGVTITLAGTSGAGATVAMTTTTAADGTFVFTGVPPSGATGYTITEVQPSGYNDGKTIVTIGQPGTPNSSKAVNVGDQDRVGGVVVAANTNRGDYIFGEVPIPGLKPPIVNGYVYLDRRHTRLRPTDGSVEGQSGWTVVLRQGNLVICTTTTNDKGFYQFDNLHCPGYEQSGLPTGPGFSITFDREGSNLPAVPTSGGDRGQVPPSGGQILNITLNPSDQVVEQNLPLDPAGTIYNSLTRATVAGAVITIAGPAGFDPATHLVGGLAAQTQTTGTDGLYQFLLQNGYPTGTYTLTVTAPANFQPGVSTTIPVCPGALTVRLIPNPALVQAFDNPPPSSAPNSCPGLIAGGANSTQYYLQFVITNGGSADILNNHIPLDPVLVGALFITKTSPMVNVARGDLVPYTITATNTETRASGSVTIRDQLPAGFKYRDGTATKNGVKAAASVENGFVTWPAETFAPKQKNTYTLMLTVGAGVSDGDYVNRAWGAVPTAPGAPATNIASATVRIVPDPTFDCPDIIGKVFDDKNANGFQDDGEPGIPAVRVATANGLLITSDAEGRFHIPCPMTPDQDRGSNFVLKLDARTLPSGFRLTTENPASIRVTRGKMVKLNFGATIHRVVRVELSDAAFEPGTTNLKAEFRAGIDTMPAALAERPSVVRLAYRTGSDAQEVVKKRIEAVRALIRNGWTASKGRYPLDVEVEGGQQ